MLGGLGSAATATAGDRALLRAVDLLPAVDAAARDALSGSPDAVQRLYDRARDASEDIRAAAPVSATCRGLWQVATAAALGHVRAAEGVDRLSPGAAVLGRRAAAAARGRLAGARRRCRPAAAARPDRVTQLANPRSGEAVFGDVVAPAPRGTIAAELQVDGAAGERTPVLEQNVVLTSQVEFGRHDLTAVFFGNQPEPLGTATSEGVWGLPASALAATDGAARDGALSRRLERVARGFPGYSAVWVQDLATGQTAGYNADARFPAASTVKLALLIGALGRQGSSPEDSRDTYDLRAMAGWSSNLATNRILATMGGSALAQRVMTGVGATRSTFTGGYIVGTEIQPALPSGGVTGEPPATSFRVTTARDLGRLLFALHASATGRADALAATGLTRHQARVGVAMLLDSEQRGDNLSLVAGGVPKGTPIAQKNGWLRRARHGAAIIYGPGGPRIVVVLTYADRGISREQAAKVGAAAARASP